MSQQRDNRTTDLGAMAYIGLILALILGLFAPFTQAQGNDTRLTRSIDGYRPSMTQSKTTTLDSKDTQRQAPLQLASEEQGSTDTGSAYDNSDYQLTLAGLNQNFWFFSALGSLLHDDDGDGYYHRFSVRFDADTSYSSARVYAKLYLSYEGGPWNHYATTAEFDIAGERGDDDYEVVTELDSGYPSGRYDVLIQLYTAEYQQLVGLIGPYETEALGTLLLEDAESDYVFEETVEYDVHASGGCSLLPNNNTARMDLLLPGLVLLASLYLLRRRKTRLSTKQLTRH